MKFKRMKTLIKLSLVGLFLLLPTCIYADQPIRYGVVGGVNVSSIHASGTDYKAGFHVGGKMDVLISNNWYLDVSALFSMKGWKSTQYLHYFEEEILETDKYTLNNYYFEVPIHAMYKIQVSPKVSINLSAGPYLGLGLFGKVHVKAKTSSYSDLGKTLEEAKDSASLYKSGSGDKRFDFGIGAKVGVEINKKFQISAGYDWGFLKSNSGDDSQNRNIPISFTYIF